MANSLRGRVTGIRFLCSACHKLLYKQNLAPVFVRADSWTRCINTSPPVLGTPINEFLQQQSSKNEKAKKVSKFAALAQGVVNAGGGSTDPNSNKALADFLVRCQKEGIAKSMILNSISKKAFDKEVVFLLTGANNTAKIIGCKTSNQKQALTNITSVLKKSTFRGTLRDPSQITNYFERKGVVIVPQPFENGHYLTEEEGTELALDVEAEDVLKCEEGLKFLCEDKSWRQMEKSLKNKNIPIIYSNADYVPKELTSLEGDDLDSYELFRKMLDRKVTPMERMADFYDLGSNFE
ncbi:putative transcriptional regulatory protein Arth_2304 [Clavelina lepadiformis]|uniref:putative transcriptional regulatory protein Arth_2304 n=1 Tax=Clavelina lepadiformis TaxID=159417 RepID=UPI004041D7B5